MIYIQVKSNDVADVLSRQKQNSSSDSQDPTKHFKTILNKILSEPQNSLLIFKINHKLSKKFKNRISVV